MVNRVITQRTESSFQKGKDGELTPRTKASLAAKKEVEQNQFKELIDISDLIEFEQNPAAVEEEVQNIMLCYNSELKSWYRNYATKVEATKSEESCSMTLR